MAGHDARKILPFEEDDAPCRRDHSSAGVRILRGMRSCGPIAVSTSIISRFGSRLDDSFSGEWPPGAGSAAGSAFISTRCGGRNRFWAGFRERGHE